MVNLFRGGAAAYQFPVGYNRSFLHRHVRRAPKKAVTFTDMAGVVHDVLTSEPLSKDSDRIDVTFFYRGFQKTEFDVPRKTAKSKRFYWE